MVRDIYCGNGNLPNNGYMRLGTLMECLQTGVGVGKSSGKRLKPDPSRIRRNSTYCGFKASLPDGYSEFGTRHGCLKKGVGVGMMENYDAWKQRLNTNVLIVLVVALSITLISVGVWATRRCRDARSRAPDEEDD
jgi:hypothetical protein